jgi:hypothetical protein
LQRRLAHQPHQEARIALPVQLAFGAERTPIAVVQVGVGDRDVRGRAVRVGGVPAMSASAGRVAGRRRIGGGCSARRGRADAGAGQHVAGLLRRGAQEQVPEAGERGALLVEELRHIAQGVDGGFQRRVLVLGERRVPGPIDEAFEISHAQIDRGDRRRHLSPRSGARGSLARADSPAPL